MLSEAEVFRIIPLIPAAKSLFAQMFAPNPEHLKTLATDTLNHVTSKLDVIPVAGKDAVQQFEPFNSVNDVKLKKTFTTINSALSTYLAKLQAALAKIIPDANKAKDEAVAAILEAGKNSSSSIKEATLAGYIAPHWPKIMNSSGQKIFNCDVQLFKNQFEGIIKIEKTNLACAAVVTGKKSEMGVVVQKVVEIALVDLKLVTEAIPSCLKSVGVTNVAQTDALPADKVATLDTCLNSVSNISE